MYIVELVLLVLMFGAVSGLAAPYLKFIPLPLLQIALGCAISWPEGGVHISLNPELFLLLFIPPLLFADGWRIPKREFFSLLHPILTLAFGLVFVTVIGLGYFIHLLVPAMPLPVAFALAAVLSPTDAVAVSAITRNLHMPSKTMHILEGESLLNDASGLVALKFAVAAAMTGSFSLLDAGRSFAWVAIGGVVVGSALGFIYGRMRARFTRRLGDVLATQMVLLHLLLPFAAYILSERLGVSGILAAVAAGVSTNFSDLARANFVSERMQANSAWYIVESTFNGATFLLLGIQLPSLIREAQSRVDYSPWQLLSLVLLITLAVMALRALWLRFGVQHALLRVYKKGKMQERPDNKLTTLATLSGIRGAVTLAGALSIPLTLPSGQVFPERSLVVMLAAGVIIATLLIGSVGLPLVIRTMPVFKETQKVREERRARIAACHAALEDLQAYEADEGTTSEQALRATAVGRISKEYRDRLGVLEETVDPDLGKLRERLQCGKELTLELELRLATMRAEREEIYSLRRRHLINDESLRSLVGEIDLAEVALARRLKTSRTNLYNLLAALDAASSSAAVETVRQERQQAEEAAVQADEAAAAAARSALLQVEREEKARAEQALAARDEAAKGAIASPGEAADGEWSQHRGEEHSQRTPG